MDIWNSDKLLLFIAFVVPGFVSLKTYQLFFQSDRKNSADQLIDAIAYSCLNYALLFWPLVMMEEPSIKQHYPISYRAFYFFVFFVAPIAWVCIYAKLRTTQFFQGSLPHPMASPWEYVFSQRKPYWMIVTLKDGKKIAGRYDSASFTSSTPAREQIYLEEAWQLNSEGAFDRPIHRTAGVLVLSSEIEAVELFHLKGENDGHEENDVQRGVPAVAEGVPARQAN